MTNYICIATRHFMVDNCNGRDYPDSEQAVFFADTLQHLKEQLAQYKYDTAIWNLNHDQAYLDKDVTFEFSPVYQVTASEPFEADAFLAGTEKMTEFIDAFNAKKAREEAAAAQEEYNEREQRLKDLQRTRARLLHPQQELAAIEAELATLRSNQDA